MIVKLIRLVQQMRWRRTNAKVLAVVAETHKRLPVGWECGKAWATWRKHVASDQCSDYWLVVRMEQTGCIVENAIANGSRQILRCDPLEAMRQIDAALEEVTP